MVYRAPPGSDTIPFRTKEGLHHKHECLLVVRRLQLGFRFLLLLDKRSDASCHTGSSGRGIVIEVSPRVIVRGVDRNW